MRFLVDADLSPQVAARLRDGGHEASHVQDHGLLNADDEKILHHALDTGHVIISADSDFATMLALTGMVAPPSILLRSAEHLSPTEQAHLLLANGLPLYATNPGEFRRSGQSHDSSRGAATVIVRMPRNQDRARVLLR